MAHIGIIRGAAGRVPGTLPRPEQAYAAIEAAFAEWVTAQTPALLEALNENAQVQESGGIEDPTITRQIEPARIPAEQMALVKRALLYGVLPELSFRIDEGGTLAILVSGNDRAEFEARVSFEVVVPLPEVNPAQRDTLQKSFAYQLVSGLNKIAAANAAECQGKMNGRVPVAVFVNGAAWAMAAWADEALVKSGLRVSEDIAVGWLANGEQGYVVRSVNAPIPRSLTPGLPEGFLPERPLLIEVLSGGGERKPEELGQAIVAELRNRMSSGHGLSLLAKGFGIARPGTLELVQSEIAKLIEDMEFNASAPRPASEHPSALAGKLKPPTPLTPLGRKASAEDKARLKERMEKVRSLIRAVNGMAEKPVTKDQMAQVLHMVLTLTECGKGDKALAFLHDHLTDFRGDALVREVQELEEMLKG